MEQSAFDFTAPRPVLDGDFERLLHHLKLHPGFHTAKDLHRALGLSDRKVRQLAESARGLVISGPGSPGYCHLDHCPVEQLAHIADTLISQGRAMTRRGIRTRRLAHQRIR